MKKLLTLLVIMMYGVASMGASVHLHYCCGKLQNISFSTVHNTDCAKKDGLNKQCCKSAQLDIKILADQAAYTNIVVLPVEVHTTTPAHAVCSFHPSGQEALTVFTTGPPAGDNNIPLYLQHCVFRI